MMDESFFVIKDKFNIRRITPMECLALQGFPPSFTFPSTVSMRGQYKQVGNTVCETLVLRIITELK